VRDFDASLGEVSADGARRQARGVQLSDAAQRLLLLGTSFRRSSS
jgi:hypothetical protein